MPAKIFCDMPAKICDNITLWYACNHIFSHLCDCDMLAGERSVAGSLGLVLGSLWLSNSSLGAQKREIPSNEHDA